MGSLKSIATLALAGLVLIVVSLVGGSALDPTGFVGLALVAIALLGVTHDPFGSDRFVDGLA